VYQAALLFHLGLLTYWLGGDLGVFYSSRHVLRPELSAEARTTALKIMSFLDLAPRMCLVLFLPSGVLLSATRAHGATFFSAPLVIVTWAFGLFWLALTIVATTRDHDALGRRAQSLDLVVRFGVVAALVAGGLYTILAAEPFGVTTNPKWLGAKVLLYALAIACGIGIRFRLRPFGSAYMELVRNGSSASVEQTLRRAINGSIPYVLTIWACIVGAAVLGVVKPGANL